MRVIDVYEGAAAAHRLVLQRLSRTEFLHLLAREGSPAPDAPEAGTVHRRSGGNPLLVLALTPLAQQAGRARRLEDPPLVVIDTQSVRAAAGFRRPRRDWTRTGRRLAASADSQSTFWG